MGGAFCGGVPMLEVHRRVPGAPADPCLLVVPATGLAPCKPVRRRKG